MDAATIWKQFFANWPEGLPQKGVVITNFDEQVVFVKFLMADQVVMLERLAPDTLGGRRLIIPYGNILSIKVTEAVNDDVFVKAGFTATGKKRAVDRASIAAPATTAPKPAATPTPTSPKPAVTPTVHRG